jgi:hypothetical protein
MLRVITISAFLVSTAASAVAAPAQPAAKGADRVVCVPLRDASNHPTGSTVCRTGEQWASILRANHLQRTAPDENFEHFIKTDAFISPISYYRGH